ncbi:hypothetical protein [Streptomyces lavendulocolor]|uniref:hypothetical protein n=1 Tax=Streptomyces lavendulocolor TaxID=67316 RepID=UPI003C2E8C28
MSPRRQTGTQYRPHVERTDAFDRLFGPVNVRDAAALLAVVVFGTPDEQIAKALGMGKAQVSRAIRRTAEMLRHPSSLAALKAHLDDIGAEAVLVDTSLRDFIKTLKMEEWTAPTCGQCGTKYAARPRLYSRAGRPRRYCSNACRQKAYRARSAGGR